MYSKEQKLKAVLLYIKYGCRASITIKELGYPCRHLIREWYLEYQEKGEFTDRNLPKYSTSRFYSMDQMQRASYCPLRQGLPLQDEQLDSDNGQSKTHKIYVQESMLSGQRCL